MSRSRVTATGGRAATTRHIPPRHALAVGMPTTPAPNGWRWIPLTKIARLESGHTPSRRNPEYWDGDIPWISIQDAKAHHGGKIADTIEHTNPLGIANSSARLLPKNTVCLSRTASVGYVVITDREMATSQDFVNWICSDELDPEFLKCVFLAEGDDLLRFASGAVHQTIYFPEAKAFHICCPSVREQREIVGRLNETLLAIGAAAENASRTSAKAREVTHACIQNAFASNEHTNRRLGDIAEVQSGGTPLVSDKANWGGEFAWYSSGELNARYTNESERSITAKGLTHSNAKLFPKGSLLIGMYDTAACKMSVLDRTATFNQAIAGVKPNDTVDAMYLYYAITAQKSELLSRRRGVRQKNLSLAKIRDITLPVPPINTQRLLVEKLTRIEDAALRLETIGQEKGQLLERLRLSVLHAGVTGLL